MFLVGKTPAAQFCACHTRKEHTSLWCQGHIRKKKQVKIEQIAGTFKEPGWDHSIFNPNPIFALSILSLAFFYSSEQRARVSTAFSFGAKDLYQIATLITWPRL